MDRGTGIAGLTGMFRERMAKVPDGAKVCFAGSVAVCTPFAELLSYSVKDRGFELIYLPRADPSKARPIRWDEGVGFTVAAGGADPQKADVIVVLGGLAMPKFGCAVDEVRSMVERIGTEGTMVVGVGFMDIFTRSGWRERIRFDSVINADITVEEL